MRIGEKTMAGFESRRDPLRQSGSPRWRVGAAGSAAGARAEREGLSAARPQPRMEAGGWRLEDGTYSFPGGFANRSQRASNLGRCRTDALRRSAESGLSVSFLCSGGCQAWRWPLRLRECFKLFQVRVGGGWDAGACARQAEKMVKSATRACPRESRYGCSGWLFVHGRRNRGAQSGEVSSLLRLRERHFSESRAQTQGPGPESVCT